MSVELKVMSRQAAKSFRSEAPWAAISVSTESGDFPELSATNRVGLLRLRFWDIIPRPGTEDRLGDKLFSKDQAKQILDFSAEVWDKIDCMLVHCEAGRSRSPAIAAALAIVHFGPGGDRRLLLGSHTPNYHVFKTILEVKYGPHFKGAEAALPVEEVHDEPWDCNET